MKTKEFKGSRWDANWKFKQTIFKIDENSIDNLLDAIRRHERRLVLREIQNATERAVNQNMPKGCD